MDIKCSASMKKSFSSHFHRNQDCSHQYAIHVPLFVVALMEMAPTRFTHNFQEYGIYTYSEYMETTYLNT